jgi:drug/metabolite transporter (DMT)-like permease
MHLSRPIGIPRPSRTLVSALLGALFVLCWSSGFIGAKLGAGQASVTTILMWRFVPAAFVLLPLAWALRQPGRYGGRAGSTDTLTFRSAARHVCIGLLSQAGYLLTVYWAIALGVSTGTTALIDGVQPLVAAVLVGPLLGIVATGRQWLGMLLGLLGVLLVTWADASFSSTQAPVWAYAVPFVGMLALLGSTIIERRQRVRPSATAAFTIHCTTSAVVFTGLAVATGTARPPAAGAFWIAMVWLILFATLGGYGLYWLLVERLGVTAVNSLMFLIAPVTGVWGSLMFGEPLTVHTLTGLGLALVAAAVVTSQPGRATHAESPGRRAAHATRSLGRAPAPTPGSRDDEEPSPATPPPRRQRAGRG